MFIKKKYVQKTYNEKTYELLVLYHIGALENSIHFIFDKATKKCVIIDPACEASLFLDIIKEKDYELSSIWLTHWHLDHVNATAEIVANTGVEVYIGKNELKYLDKKINPILLNDNQQLNVGNTEAKVIYASGHSAGGVCYLLDGRIIVGDTLFIYGAGHCFLPGANPVEFYHTMQRIKNEVPDDTYIHCGHDYGSSLTTTMLQQKQGNPFLLIDNEDDFVRYRTQIHDKFRKYPMCAMSKLELNKVL